MKPVSDEELAAKWWRGAPRTGLETGLTSQQVYTAAQLGKIRSLFDPASRAWFFEIASCRRYVAERQRQSVPAA